MSVSTPTTRAIFRETLRETLRPRRAVPLAFVAIALVSAEWVASRSLVAIGADLLLVALFVLLAPTLWRVLVGGAASVRAGTLGWAGFALVAAAVVGSVLVLPPLLSGAWTYVGDPNAFFLLVTLFVVGGWGLGRDVELERGVEVERARAEKLALLAEQAQLLALRAQLDPHFLFNTLNAIAEWCREDPVVAERATLQLASLLRRLFDALRGPRWTLADELALVEELSALYATRDAERFVFVLELPEAREASLWSTRRSKASSWWSRSEGSGSTPSSPCRSSSADSLGRASSGSTGARF